MNTEQAIEAITQWVVQFQDSLLVSLAILVAAFVLAWALRWAVRRLFADANGTPVNRLVLARRGINLAVLVAATFAVLEQFGIEVQTVLDYSFMNVGPEDTKLTVGKVLAAIAIVLLSVLAGKLVETWLQRAVPASSRQAKANIATLGRLSYYVVVPLGFAIAVQSVGFDLTALLTLGGVFVVALGFATKNIAENFVSGVILLVERSIKPDDILEVEDEVVRVTHMGIRTTIGRTREGEDLIIPNALLCSSKVKNYTYRDMQFRVHVKVGVHYQSHLPTVFKVLQRTLESLDFVKPSPPPKVVLEEFGDNSVVFAMDAWTDDPWRERPLRSEIARVAWDALHEAGIVIAYPQRDVHFDAELLEVFDRVLPGERRRKPADGETAPPDAAPPKDDPVEPEDDADEARAA